MKAQNWIAALIVSLVFAGCGGGGGGGDSVSAIPEPEPTVYAQVQGTYQLTGFTIYWGPMYSNAIWTEKSPEVKSFSGTLIVGEFVEGRGDVSLTMMVNGATQVTAFSGRISYEMGHTDTSGAFTFGDPPEFIKWTLIDNNLTTTIFSDRTSDGIGEHDYWVKVSQ